MAQDVSGRTSGVFANLWQQKRLIAVTCALTLAGTMVWSHYFLPSRYSAETTILIVPPRIPLDVVETDSVGERLTTISKVVLSRSRLTLLIDEFDLYQTDRDVRAIEDVVELMRRRDIGITRPAVDQARNGVESFKVTYSSEDPQVAMRVAERLAASIVQEHIEESELLAESRLAFVKAQTEDLKRQVAESERIVETQRLRNGSVAQSDLLEYEVRQDMLKALFTKQHELTFAVNRARRQVGEQFRIIDGARVPERPVGLNQLQVNTAGGAAGLMLGLMLAAAASRRQRRA